MSYEAIIVLLFGMFVLCMVGAFGHIFQSTYRHQNIQDARRQNMANKRSELDKGWDDLDGPTDREGDI